RSLLISNDGRERCIDDSAAPIRDKAGRGIGTIVVFHDVTEQRRAERRTAARNAVTSVLAEAASLTKAAPKLLEALCRNLRFEVGAFWNFDDESGEGKCLSFYEKPGDSFKNFRRATEALRVRRGIGLPGRIWANGTVI